MRSGRLSWRLCRLSTRLWINIHRDPLFLSPVKSLEALAYFLCCRWILLFPPLLASFPCAIGVCIFDVETGCSSASWRVFYVHSNLFLNCSISGLDIWWYGVNLLSTLILDMTPNGSYDLVSYNIVVIILQLLGLPSLLLSTRNFVTNLEAMVLYAQVIALTAGCHLISWHKFTRVSSQLLWVLIRRFYCDGRELTL